MYVLERCIPLMIRIRDKDKRKKITMKKLCPNLSMLDFFSQVLQGNNIKANSFGFFLTKRQLLGLKWITKIGFVSVLNHMLSNV